jgi:hypothetical protein
LLRCPKDRESHSLQVRHNIVVREPQHPIATRCEPSIALFIVSNALFEIMALTIDLDDELAGMGNKVGNIVAHRRLSTKADAGEPMGLEVAPKQRFGVRHRASELFGAIALDVPQRSVRHTPLPTLPCTGGESQTVALTSLWIIAKFAACF